MRYPFESPEASELNKKIFETIYYASLTASCELAKSEGPYETYVGSPVSKGVSGDSGAWIRNEVYYQYIHGLFRYDVIRGR